MLTGLIGSGKSEILRAIAGIDRFSTGQVAINGRARRVRRGSAVDRRVGFVPEDPAAQGLFLVAP